MWAEVGARRKSSKGIYNLGATPWRGRKQSWNSGGIFPSPFLRGVISISSRALGDLKVKFCSTEVKIRKSSERARLSPRQKRLPEGVRGTCVIGGALRSTQLPHPHSPGTFACSFTQIYI